MVKYCINHPNRRAINMKYCLCYECNFRRTHNGKSNYDVSLEKNINKLKEKKFFTPKKIVYKLNKKPKKIYRIKVSLKQQEIKKNLSIAYNEIDSERELICTGCNKYQGGDIRLSHSHIISQKDCKLIGKPELIYDKKDITYHCVDFGNNIGCHRKWESKDPKIMSTLLDYESNMIFIKSQSIELYNKIVNKNILNN